MRAIDLADLVVIAGRVRGTGPGAALDQVDLAAARTALAAAKPPEAELIEAELIEAEPAEPARGAVLLIRALLRHRPLKGLTVERAQRSIERAHGADIRRHIRIAEWTPPVTSRGPSPLRRLTQNSAGSHRRVRP